MGHMKATVLKLSSPPIVEAVVDIDCDMPPGLEIAALEAPARDLLRDRYPKFRTQLVYEHQIKRQGTAPPEMSVRHAVQALRFFHDDEKQLVQVRLQGFSFNRLAPYSSLDDYSPEIERTWRLFVQLAGPVQVRLIRLRYINRILLPATAGRVDLDHYLRLGPKLPDEDNLTLAGFLHQHTAVEVGTRNQVNIVLTAQPVENEKLPIILDIETFEPLHVEPNDWSSIRAKIQSLRNLKNMVFKKSLTRRCLKLFQQRTS